MELTSQLHAFLWTASQANNCNTYLIQSDPHIILIDPGHAAYFDHVRSGLRQLGLSLPDVDLILCTHAHPDHIEAVRLFDQASVLFALHPTEWQLVLDMAPVIRQSLDFDPDRLSPGFFLTEGDLTVGDIQLNVYHTPGHSPGSVTLHWPKTGALFTGDLVFNQGVGRTDLPGGDPSQLKKSIARMAALEAKWLLSGHGDVVSGAASVGDNFKRVERSWLDYM